MQKNTKKEKKNTKTYKNCSAEVANKGVHKNRFVKTTNSALWICCPMERPLQL